jgi:hypothetical protein
MRSENYYLVIGHLDALTSLAFGRRVSEGPSDPRISNLQTISFFCLQTWKEALEWCIVSIVSNPPSMKNIIHTFFTDQ